MNTERKITEQEYLDALAIVSGYLEQIKQQVSAITFEPEAVAFKREIDDWFALEKGVSIKVVGMKRSRPSIHIGDILTVTSRELYVDDTSALYDGIRNRRTYITVRAKNSRSGKIHTIKAAIRQSHIGEHDENGGVYGSPIVFKILK